MRPVTKIAYSLSFAVAVAAVVTTILLTEKLALKIILGGTSLACLGMGLISHAIHKPPKITLKPTSATVVSKIDTVSSHPTSVVLTDEAYYEQEVQKLMQQWEVFIRDASENEKIILNEFYENTVNKIKDFFSKRGEHLVNPRKLFDQRLQFFKNVLQQKHFAQLVYTLEVFKKLCKLIGNLVEGDATHAFEQELFKIDSQDINGNYSLFGSTILISLASRGHCTRCLGLLLGKGASLGQRDLYENTPLHWAIANAHNSMAFAIIERSSAEVLNMQDNGAVYPGNTPLMLAVCKGYRTKRQDNERLTVSNVDLVEALLKKGADPNIQDKAGNTALHFAAITHDVEMVNILLKAGARKDIKNQKGQIPKDFLTLNRVEADAFMVDQVGVFLFHNFVTDVTRFDL